jgi:hypothetical protein
MYYVIEDRRSKFTRVVDQPPRKRDKLIATCRDHHDAFVVLELHENHKMKWKNLRDAVLCFALISVLIGTAAMIPDLEPAPPPEPPPAAEDWTA